MLESRYRYTYLLSSQFTDTPVRVQKEEKNRYIHIEIKVLTEMAKTGTIDNFIHEFDRNPDVKTKLQMFYRREDVQQFIRENLGFSCNYGDYMHMRNSVHVI